MVVYVMVILWYFLVKKKKKTKKKMNLNKINELPWYCHLIHHSIVFYFVFLQVMVVYGIFYVNPMVFIVWVANPNIHLHLNFEIRWRFRMSM